jgi:hypothetical protein
MCYGSVQTDQTDFYLPPTRFSASGKDSHFTLKCSAVVTQLHTNCYSFTDPEGMVGGVNPGFRDFNPGPVNPEAVTRTIAPPWPYEDRMPWIIDGLLSFLYDSIKFLNKILLTIHFDITWIDFRHSDTDFHFASLTFWAFSISTGHWISVGKNTPMGAAVKKWHMMGTWHRTN